ncbi:hypothetical protein Cenrod_2644 [Candidatus Symbiobacter mobilis CR]|uniref:Uncharacterized protein n=1 Tax=Candidatus Symbiobacter mobilis CR TaxID=946483 RepID=U5NEV2_9BURK|nr:hypothetical protein Cenrod_2644 [Candidatus Symbiobacter mobilis CR]
MTDGCVPSTDLYNMGVRCGTVTLSIVKGAVVLPRCRLDRRVAQIERKRYPAPSGDYARAIPSTVKYRQARKALTRWT